PPGPGAALAVGGRQTLSLHSRRPTGRLPRHLPIHCRGVARAVRPPASGHAPGSLGPTRSLARRRRMGGRRPRRAHSSPQTPMKTPAATIRVLMITSAWPAPGHPRTTYFIKRQVDFLRAAGVDVDVFHFKAARNPWNYLKAW